MAGSTLRLVETTEYYTINYVRSSRAIGVLWGVFTLCYAIIGVVVFVQPQWIGDTTRSPGSGHFGLWRHCAPTTSLQGGRVLNCFGRLSDLSTNISGAFQAATVLVGLAVVVALLTVTCCLMFCFLQPHSVFRLCGWMQLLSGSCMLMAVLVFPAGWDAARLREVCGPHADQYRPGGCRVRWALVLALLGALDALVLAALALALGRYRAQAPPEPEHYSSVGVAPWSGGGQEAGGGLLDGAYRPDHPGSLGTPLNGAAMFRSASAGSLADSRRSLNLKLLPGMMMPPPSREPERFPDLPPRPTFPGRH